MVAKPNLRNGWFRNCRLRSQIKEMKQAKDVPSGEIEGDWF
jgi:hypothetical protein